MNYRFFFETLEIYNEIRDALIRKGQFGEEQKKYYDEVIIKVKREYRKWLKDNNKKKYLYHSIDGKGYGEIVACHWEYDDGWKKIFFPGEHWNDEEKKEFIEENWHNCRASIYDCTGDIFTWAINCFNVPSGVICYIREGLDV